MSFESPGGHSFDPSLEYSLYPRDQRPVPDGMPVDDPLNVQTLTSGLDTESSTSACSEYDRIRQEILTGTDWQSVFTRAFGFGGEYEGLDSLVGALRADHEQNSPENFKGEPMNTVRLHSWQKHITERGMTAVPDDSEPVPDDWEPHGNLASEVITWRQEMSKAADVFFHNDRNAFIQAVLPRKEAVQTLSRLCTLMGLDGDAPDVPSELREPAYWLEQCVRNMYVAVDEADSVFLHTVPDVPLEIRDNGLASQFHELCGMSPEALLQLAMQRYAPDLVRGLAIVELLPTMPPMVFPDERRVDTAATMEVENGVGVLRLNMDPASLTVDMTPAKQSDSSLRGTQQAANSLTMLQLVDHELGHHTHHLRDPLRWLVQWRQMARADPFDDNEYVKDVYTISSDEGEIEDLAMSRELYMNRPLDLLLSHAARFTILQRKHGRYTIDMLMKAADEAEDNTAASVLRASERLVARANAASWS